MHLIRNIPIKIVLALLAIAGIFLGYVLTRNYYLHVIGGEASSCAISAYVDCDRVSESTWATIGRLPISAIGLGLMIVTLESLIFFGGRILFDFGNSPPRLHWKTLGSEGNGEPVFSPDGPMQLHSDQSYYAEPCMATLLNARVLPSSGGETVFADMRAVCAAMPAAAIITPKPRSTAVVA